MTTVIYKDGTLFADTRMNRGGHGYQDGFVKLFRTCNAEHSFIFGVSGPAFIVNNFKKWLVDGPFPGPVPKELKKEEFLVIVARSDGKAFTVDDYGVVEYPEGAPIVAGSGGPFAQGALAAGATPEEAIKAAASLDPHTSPSFTSLSF